MARGFGATAGVGTTDSIVTSLTAHATQRTYAGWSYRQGGGGGNLGRVWEKRSGAQAQVELLLWNGALSQMEFGRTFSGGTNSWDFSDPGTNVWYHWAIVYDSGAPTNNPVIYVNGSSVTLALVGGSHTTGTASANSSPYVVGNRTNDNARNWDGRHADFAIWDRLLTASEIAALYAEGPSALPDYLLWLPLWGNDSPEPEWRQAAAAGAAVTGTARREHPPTYDRAWRWWRAAGAAEFGGSVPIILSGTMGGVGGVVGSLQVSRLLSGTSAGGSAVAATLEIRRLLAGAPAGVGTAAAALRIERFLAGAAAGAGAPAGELEIRRLLTGALAGAGDSSGALEIVRRLAAVVAGEGTTAAELLVSRLLTGTVIGTGTVAGDLRIIRALVCYGGSVELALLWGGLVAVAVELGGAATLGISCGGIVGPVRLDYGGSVAPALNYGGSVEVCDNE